MAPKRKGQTACKCLKNWIEQFRLVERRSTSRIANLLLMVPLFRVFSRDVKPVR